MRLRLLWRAASVLLLDALTLLVLSELMSGFVLDGSAAPQGRAFDVAAT